MKHYRFGSKGGRYIGNANGLRVYSHGIVPEVNEERQAGKEHREDGQIWFDYGPSTGGLLESVGISFLTPGELISRVEVDHSFKKRRLKVIGLSVDDALLTVERINGFHAASHSIAFCSAVEDAIGIGIDNGLSNSRMIMLELERIRSHLEVIKRVCEPAGFGVPYSQIGYLRERVSRLISSVSGHRYFFSSNRIGSAEVSTEGLAGELDRIEVEFRRIYDGLLRSKIFLNRIQGTGRLGTGIDLIGPAARGCNRNIDARADSPTLDYSRTGYEIQLTDEGDSFSRFYVRSMEVLNSISIIREISGDIYSDQASVDPSGSGEGAGRVESPQGDLFYYVRVNDGTVEDMKMASPSLMNILAFRESMKGNIFTDFHFNWESYGIWISEAGVEFY